MPRSDSGRILVEVDVETKDQLYLALARDKLTVRQWFLACAENYIKNPQLGLQFPINKEADKK